MFKKIVLVGVTTLTVLGAPGLVHTADAASARQFANCTALNKTYPHGVGRAGARDHTSSTPVRNFTRNTTVYRQNSRSDRDKDGIACEKR